MLSDPRFIVGAILAAAVLAVSSFALYATLKVMQQAKAGGDGILPHAAVHRGR
jgi:hypothetical protein